jgi:hypothetical protein|tara:strand:+ start:762 stop:3494 length:2733 start_codon:yes stop_codon:yes gene_type:complete
MTSSFGTIVGRERDELPGYGVKNYAETEPDLTDEVNEQITANQQDTIQFYNEMATIQKELAERPLRNLEALANFSTSASRAIQTFQDRQEAQEKINEAMDFLDKNSTAELYTKEGTLELENAKFDNELLNENTDASLDFLRARNIPVPEDIGIKQLLRNLNTSYFGARSQFLNENGASDIIDSEQFIELHNAADELLVTAMLRKARELNIDTNSREFRKAFYNTIYPDIKQRRENNIQSWKNNANRNFKRINKEKTRDIIVKTLEPYQVTDGRATPIDIDVMTLVETVKNRIPEVKTNRDAIEYIFSEVAAETGEDDRRLNTEHLEYLYNGAIFEHSATGVKSTIEDGDFNFKDTLNNIMQQAEIDRATEVSRGIQADEILAKQEYEALKDQYPNGIPPKIESDFLRDIEKKYPHFDATKLNSNNASITTGGEYPNAGKPDATNQYYKDLEGALIGTGNTKLEMTNDLRFQVDKAYGDFQRRVANQVAVGVEPEAAERNAYDIVEANLLAGKYTLSSVEERQGRIISPADISDDRNLLQSDTNTVRFNNQFNSIAEKKALLQYKAHKLYGDVPFPNYFKGVVRGTKISAEDYAEDRFTSMGGYDATGEIAQRFTPNKDGILVDKQFGLTKEELNKFNIKPHLTKTNINMLQDPELAEKVLLGFRKEGNELGTYQPNIGFGKKNGDKLTVAEVIKRAKRGDSNWGIFGFSSQEILEATKSGAISKDALFDEETQSQMVFELIRQRSNRTNSIRGAIVQAKSGGEQTIFEGDEDIGRWDRLVNMSSDEIRATLNTFPMLRDMPTNQFQNLTAGVVLEIENIIKKEEAQDNAVSRVLRIDRQLAYYNDLLGKATEGDTGFMNTRVLSKLASRFTISQERIREIIAELESNRKALEDANPNLEELIKIEKLKDD